MFESLIHDNKDWNIFAYSHKFIKVLFESLIHDNKDWNQELDTPINEILECSNH